MNQPEMMYLPSDRLLSLLFHLKQVGCDAIDPFTLALAAWEGDPVGFCPLTSSERLEFQALHFMACRVLGAPPHAPDVRPQEERDADSARALDKAQRWSYLAAFSHCDALFGYTATPYRTYDNVW